MKLVIAEKPMLGRDIARAICGKQVSESVRLPIEGNGYTVCALAGHVLELVEPAKIRDEWKWDRDFSSESLPITVPTWPKEPAKGKEGIVDQVANLLKQCDSVIHAGDPDDEGQLLVDELLDYLDYQGKVERVLVNDNIVENIRKAFSRLEDNARYRPLSDAAYARQMADMAFGVSESRLAAMRLRSKVSVGRVQTPTLGLVVSRDRAIEGHSSRLYYELVATVAADGVGEAPFTLKPSEELRGGEDRVYDRETFDSVAKALEGAAQSIDTTVAHRLKHPPLPYNLTTLQADMSKRFKYSAANTLEATQRLRDEHKAITYNRSDCSYLAEEYHAQAPSTLSVAFENIGRAWDVDYGIKGHAFDDSKVGAHGGIIPQASRFDASRLPERERRVYEAVVERYAMQFSPPMEYDESTSCSETPYGALERKTRRVTDAGFTAVFGAEEGDEAGGSPDGPFLEAGTHEGRVCGTEVVEKKTSPPKRYTEGTLITDMASVAKYVRDPELKAALKAKDDGKAGEHGGIGTTATRAGIIETLKTRGFIEVKSGKVISTEKGRAFFDAVPEEIRSADVTARWWLIQQEVAAGRADVNAVQRSVAEVFEGHRGTAYVGKTLQAAGTVVGKCPRCGADVTARGKSFSCTSNKAHKLDDGSWERYEGCGFVLFATVAGKRLTEAQAKALLAGKRPLVKGLTSKAGKKFEARLRLDSSTGKVEFEFEKGKRH